MPAADPAAPAPHAHTPRRKKARRIRPGLLRREDAADFCAVSVPTWDRMDAAGLVPASIRLIGCKAWNRRELAAWIDAKCPPRSEWAPLWASLLARRNRSK